MTPSDSDPVLLAVGCSAGSLPVLVGVVRRLPADLGAAVLVCQHTSQHGRSSLPEILSRASALPAQWAVDGGRLSPGHIYVAPAGHHLMVDDGAARLTNGPRVNRHRPSVDVLFASVAAAAGPAAVAMVLSGVLDDGAVGSALVARAGGEVLVQDPETAQFPAMPKAALAAAPEATVVSDVGGDDVVRAVRRAAGRRRTGPTMDDDARPDQDADADAAFLEAGESRLVRLACPDCGGGLAQVDLPSITYFRCHVGHQYGPQSLAAAMSETSESRLWSAVAALEEEAMLQAYVQALPPVDSAAGGPLDVPGDRADDLWGRADALRGLVQRWALLDADAGEASGDQPSASDPS